MKKSKDSREESQKIADMSDIRVVESNGSSMIIGIDTTDEDEDVEEFDYPDSAESKTNDYDSWLG